MRSRRAPSFIRVAQRGYAEASDKIQLSMALPHQSIFSSTDVVQPLRPGVVEVIESAGSKKWFISGGFATVHPNNKLTINAVEAAPLEDFSVESIRVNLQEALKVASGNGSEEDKLEARIEAEVYESLQYALGSK
ncbi:epsilon subunit of F1F0-ATP synthase N-terminal domain-containing protein [Lentinula edodes]|uniref:Epsilon subunit of F1F0-ATP synthase N-terminal domain-containing protein n=1 Tax=Lentinula edodes TaxID=5353 RepID=A0A1Q3E5C9_LENED|nr:epsilon subunit of F1F0-ATP synthase N-terminal domain-containing protein [Lentinula edodes]